MSKLAGKNLIITGGARGIHLAIAERCIQKGACVGIAAVTPRLAAEELRVSKRNKESHFAEAGLQSLVDRPRMRLVAFWT